MTGHMRIPGGEHDDMIDQDNSPLNDYHTDIFEDLLMVSIIHCKNFLMSLRGQVDAEIEIEINLAIDLIDATLNTLRMLKLRK